MKCVNSKGISFINLNHANIFIFTIKREYYTCLSAVPPNCPLPQSHV